MDAAAPPPNDDALALLQLVDERLAALAAEADGLRVLRSRLLNRIEPEERNERAA